MRKAGQLTDRRLFRGFGEKECEQLLDYLERLRANIESE